MTDWLRLVSPTGRVTLEQVGLARGRSIMKGDLSVLAPLTPARGWPTNDTAAGLGPALDRSVLDADTPFLVVTPETGEVIGDCGWKGGPGPDGRAEIGYGLAASARGLGLGTELIRTLTAWALTQPGCSTVVAEVMADNLPSRRALERTGFVVERIVGPDVWYVFPANGGAVT